MQPTATQDPATGRLVVSRDKIKEVSLNYCKKTLSNNSPEPGFGRFSELQEELQDLRMKAKDGHFMADKVLFNKVLNKFKLSSKQSYDFLTKAGSKFQNSCFKMCKKMFQTESFPDSFKDTILHMLYKGKGRKEELSCNRFIHCKTWLPRLAEACLVEGGIKKHMVEKSSRFQVGGQAGHRPEELLFCMKSMISKYKEQGKVIIGQCHDVSKFFDKEVASDTMDVLYRRGVDPKVCRLWTKMNNTRIQVRTGVGNTEKADIGAVIGQGTIGGAIASQGSLDDGIRGQFQGSQEELRYGSVEMGPLIFQDDLLEGSPGVIEARAANIRVAMVMREKRLCLNEDKSVCLVWGTASQQKEIQKELKERPLKCGEVTIKVTDSDKWLGDYLHSGGLAASVLETIHKREGKVRGAALEIAAIVDDWRAATVGGFKTGLFLWESCCLPSLLYNAGSWVDMSTEAVRKGEALQSWYLRLLLRQGPGVPAGSMMFETGTLSVALRVWREKTSLALHIVRLGEDTLAKRIWTEQQLYDWPGLAREVRDICEQLGVEQVEDTKMTSKCYRSEVTAACHRMNEARLRKQMEGKQKCVKILADEYGQKEYFNLKTPSQVRMYFSTRVSMLPIAGNFSKDNRFRRTDWLCRCGAREQEEHIRSHCEIYRDIREKYDCLDDDEKLVAFFGEVLKRRDDLEEKEKEEKRSRRRKEQEE